MAICYANGKTPRINYAAHQFPVVLPKCSHLPCPSAHICPAHPLTSALFICYYLSCPSAPIRPAHLLPSALLISSDHLPCFLTFILTHLICPSKYIYLLYSSSKFSFIPSPSTHYCPDIHISYALLSSLPLNHNIITLKALAITSSPLASA
ncbi:hypothetical protein AYI69_g3225 [Smittium culicis]|uniref:Uncharacterized protein n=1 Tax=Smittium culicis TaxID=133412 RepID=A0A1R1YKD6_9FUNG|nr:hypothetical protein AYI69_g3225 [Smittium culicis]